MNNNSSFYSAVELANLGFAAVGENVSVSRFARFYDIGNIKIGNNVRIDDFCILSGNITLADYIHISAQCLLYGAYGIEMQSFSGLSPRTTVFSASDDFSGNYMIGPMIDRKYTNVQGGLVSIRKYVQVGAGSVLFPNVVLQEGCAVGTLSLVNKSLDEWKIYAGIPARYIKEREKRIIELEQQMKNNSAIGSG